jgi:hydroxymethylbilane synthase
MNNLIMGTRGSALAQAQSLWVAQQITLMTGISVQLKVIRTKGDRIIDKPLQEIGGKGLFTAELEAELLQGGIDFAVHSLKDLPTEDPDGLQVVCIPKREDPRDALVGLTLAESNCIGTGSLRRQAQLRILRPGVTIKGIRGNVDTRLAKMDRGEYDSVVLAMAGLNRLGISRDDIRPLELSDCIPAAGQGALGIQCATHRNDVIEIIRSIHHQPTFTEIQTERTFLEVFGGGCHVAAGCIAHLIENGTIEACAVIEDQNGALKRLTLKGEDPIILGKQLALQLLQAK